MELLQRAQEGAAEVSRTRRSSCRRLASAGAAEAGRNLQERLLLGENRSEPWGAIGMSKFDWVVQAWASDQHSFIIYSTYALGRTPTVPPLPFP